MTENLIVMLFAGVFLGGIVAILVYHLLKFLKGTVKLHIEKRIFHFGEDLKGEIEIHAKKHIDVEKVELELKAYKKEKTYTNKGTKTRNVMVFQQIHTVGSSDKIMAGSKRNIGFNIQIPPLATLPKELVDAIHTLGRKHLFQSYYRGGIFSPRIHWKIRVHVSAVGIDLSRQENIMIKKSDI